jgi:hypothetical protein
VRSAGGVGEIVDVLVLDFFLGLVAETRAGTRTNGTADDRTGRPGDRAADHRAGHRAGTAACGRAGLVVTLGRLTGERSTRRADHAANDGAWRPADDGADRGAAEGTGTRTSRFGADFVLVLDPIVEVPVDVIVETRAINPFAVVHVFAS